MTRLSADRSLLFPGAAPTAVTRVSLVLPLYTATLFLSAALLFLVQPMIAKMALPRLGGTPAVWNACMVFFQACLLLGYLYAHLAPKWLGVRRQSIFHVLILLLPLLVLPIGLRHAPAGVGNRPATALFVMLAASVGLPFLAVSTTGPLLQKWFAATGHRGAADPYFLYAAGNAGSLLALVGYPALVEPFMTLNAQTTAWGAGYAVLLVAIGLCAAALWRASPAAAPREAAPALNKPAAPTRLRWVALAFVPSSYLLGVTTFITTDIAAVPLFWVIPLSLYLVSFVLVFLKNPPLPHATVVRLLPVSVVGVTLFQLLHAAQPVWLILLVHLFAFFLAATACHGALARCRPAAAHLTDFYLMMSVGGTLGGLFNALVAPTIFNRAFEYPISMVLACLLLAGTLGIARRRLLADLLLPCFVGAVAWLLPTFLGGHRIVAALLAAGAPALACVSFRPRPLRFALALAILLAVAAVDVPGGGRALDVRRSFFGVHRIVFAADGRSRALYHGTTLHGSQRYDAAGRAVDEPLTYYHRTGPAGDLFALPHQNTAVIGLGIGSLAAYAGAGDRVAYYEIDREVLRAADESGSFHFLSEARRRGARVGVVLGDARLTLADAPDGAYDLVVLDAFSGDAVPVHLLTREALRLYLRKLKPGGVLAVHVSNIYLDLKPVLAALANDAACACLTRDDLDVSPDEMKAGKSPSQWVALAREPAALDRLRGPKKWEAWSGPPVAPWTDDFSDVLGVMRWRR